MTILDKVRYHTKNTLVDHLGIEFIECSLDKIVARMQVDHRTMRPGAMLHGGATMALAETVGSCLSFINVDEKTHNIFGIEINANHISTVKEGFVKATAEYIHKGRTTQVVGVNVEDSKGKKISICRITNIVISK